LNLLLSGPPASGKSHAALEHFRSMAGSHLIVPTATMAEHLRHELARSGFRVRPSRVGTLAQLLDSWDVPKAASQPLLHSLISVALERLRPERFAAVSEFRGFHSAVSNLFEEAPPEALGDLQDVFRAVEADLAARGLALRNARLRAAAGVVRSGAAILPTQIVFDGFFTLSAAELDLVEALASQTSVIVTLPQTVRRLESAGFSVRRFPEPRRSPRRVMFSAATPEREAEELARRILEHISRGRRFRDIAIVLRSRDPYGPLIETTLARFGIAVRGYFTDPLASHPVVAYLAGLVNACLHGWDHATLAALLRMPVSGVGVTPDGDRFDFALREKLPGNGLELPHALALPVGLASIDKWWRESVAPVEWAERLKGLRRLLPMPVIGEQADLEQIHVWRSTGAALDAFDAALDSTAESFLGPETMPLVRFWEQVETTLALEPLRIEDRRRDVVHVMDVFEARQWELPVVFLCGLLEREFPQYQREDPLLDDATRRRFGLATSAQRQADERFLFELAVTRAREETVLSYSRFNEKGEETLPSFFLDGAKAVPCEIRTRPAPARLTAPSALRPIQDSKLLRQLARTHRRLSPTGIESFLQCPFQFFAGKTLRLKERPPAPRDRLNMRVKGSILHRALAEWIGAPLLGSEVFNRVFEEECARMRIPATYRSEAVRLVLLRHFEGFLDDSQMALGWHTETEKDFHFPLSPALTIRGRIDRLEIGPRDQALVIDYKYSPGSKIRSRVEESEAGNLVQGGLYLLAAERALGLQPAGMLYCGLKKEVSWGGWHVSIPGLGGIGEARTPKALRELMDDAARIAVSAHQEILTGQVSARPTDRDKCRWCDYRDACRVESIEVGQAIGFGGLLPDAQEADDKTRSSAPRL
jgi:ATP-dependent helicase/DNAse subunit B